MICAECQLRTGRFTHNEGTLFTHRIGGCMDSENCLKAVEKR